MKNRNALLFWILALFLAWCGRDGARLHGQTRPRPQQIRTWTQVRPLLHPAGSALPVGTMARAEQLAIAPATLAAWRGIVVTGAFDHYRIAYTNQPDPVFVTCSRPPNDPLGPGCLGGAFWFAWPRDPNNPGNALIWELLTHPRNTSAPASSNPPSLPR